VDNQLLKEAEQICMRLGVRFTSPRKRVLELLSQSPTPLKAYDLIAAAGPEGEAVKPPTVYRALEFLCAAGLVHRIEQDATFVACQHHHSTDPLHAHLAGLCARTAARPVKWKSIWSAPSWPGLRPILALRWTVSSLKGAACARLVRPRAGNVSRETLEPATTLNLEQMMRQSDSNNK
jgi:Fur family transcriptional regulator, zinc uptake regulator